MKNSNYSLHRGIVRVFGKRATKQNGDGLIQMVVQMATGIIMRVLQKIQNGSSIIRQTSQMMHKVPIL